MPRNNLDQDIQDRIQSFLGELSGLVKKSALEAVQAALTDGGPARKRRGPGRPRGSGRRGPGRPQKTIRRARRAVARTGKRVRRSAEDLEKIATRVLAHVKVNTGQRLEEIGAALKSDTAILKRPIANLLAAKKLRTEGQKRGTKYFAGAKRGGAGKAKARRRRKASGKRGGKRAAKAPAAPATA